ncbi:MAG: hypothetical protein ACOCU4_06990, partial [Alkalispirochaeta sp.]
SDLNAGAELAHKSTFALCRVATAPRRHAGIGSNPATVSGPLHEEAIARWRETADRLQERFEKLRALTDDAEADVPAFMRLVGALIVEQNEERHLTRRYMSNETLLEVTQPDPEMGSYALPGLTDARHEHITGYY